MFLKSPTQGDIDPHHAGRGYPQGEKNDVHFDWIGCMRFPKSKQILRISDVEFVIWTILAVGTRKPPSSFVLKDGAIETRDVAR